jgi:uncharacterized protein YndB with AHSA1/START domain
MANLYHHFLIKGSLEKVFWAFSTPEGFNNWWTKKCFGKPSLGQKFIFDFGPEYIWEATISKYEFEKSIEFTFDLADSDWQGTRIGVQLETEVENVSLKFYHEGWPDENTHFKISNYCWAMYLRLLKRYIEFGEFVEYDYRLEA